MTTTHLIDATNFDKTAPSIIKEMETAGLVGFDIETFDNAHPGLLAYRAKHPREVVFDVSRTVVAGFSLHAEDSEHSYYINLNHADAQNRVPWEKARQLLDARGGQPIVSHNASFELTMMRKSLGYELTNVLCSMQFAATLYNSDTYAASKLRSLGAGKQIFDKALTIFQSYDPSKTMTEEQAKLYYSWAGKESDALQSWNGLVKSMAMGFGLKQAVESWFGVKMRTFEETLNGKDHMGQLTGEEVFLYGADDAYWCLQLFKLLASVYADRTGAMEAFVGTENPMIEVYSRVWSDGIRIDSKAVDASRLSERENFGKALRVLQSHLQKLLPFKAEPCKSLDQQDWYTKNPSKYRNVISSWALATHDDVVGSVSGSTASEFGHAKFGPNFSYYMVMRTLLHDLLDIKPVFDAGKMTTDKNARATMLSREKDETKLAVLKSLNEISEIEQRMKLYISPYRQLIDPDTNRMHPVLNSLLATRRTAMQKPNGQQLAKRGSSTYVRGFYLADRSDHLLVSLDWSQIELVLIGEFSGDPQFAEAYGQRPYKDLHIGATVDALQVLHPELTLEAFKDLKRGIVCPENKAVLTHAGKEMTPEKAFKFWRTEIGKGSNFNYWYSGSLYTVGERFNWSKEQVFAVTDRYRQRFEVAEQWRVGVIHSAQMNGYVQLPDGTRRDRFEATQAWATMFKQLINQSYGRITTGAHIMADKFIRDTQRRAGNQCVNALIQGSCATLAKWAILNILPLIQKEKMDARFVMLVHDELVFSVQSSQALEFIELARKVMRSHPTLVRNLVVDCSASVGRTFEPWGPTAPYGQIELDEAPALPFIPPESVGEKMSPEQCEAVVKFLEAA